MSFKRDGNDSNALRILQKRRIRELLGEEIPEDEVKLLSNGRYACLVCHHKPIFDTVDMLNVHRKGKKHLHYDVIEKEKKEELRELIKKRKHEKYLKDGTTDIQVAKTSHKGLALGARYDPRSKKQKVHSRRERVNLDHHSVQTTDSSSLPGNHSESKEISQGSQVHKKGSSLSNSSFRHLLLQHQTEKGPLKHNAQLKNAFESLVSVPQTSESLNIHPYVSNKSRNRQFVKSHTTSSCYKHGGNSKQDLPIPVNSNDIIYLAKYQTPAPQLNKGKCEKRRYDTCSESAGENWEEKNKKTEIYLQLRGAGWKKDLDGKWIKDENAEFDSDEEPPNLP